MSFQAQSVQVKFPLAVYDHPLQGHADFKRTVKRAEVAMKGFRVQYHDDDRNFFVQRISIQNVVVDANVVTFDVHFKIQDDNQGEDDHAYEGMVDAVVIAQLE